MKCIHVVRSKKAKLYIIYFWMLYNVTSLSYNDNIVMYSRAPCPYLHCTPNKMIVSDRKLIIKQKNLKERET